MINTMFIVMTWLTAAIATFGPVAVILGLIFAPAVAVPLISKLAKSFIECTFCVISTAVVLACIGSYWVGHHEAASVCRADELAAELRNREIDLENANRARSDETERANKIEGDSSEQHSKDLTAIAELKRRPGTCAFDNIDSGVSGMPNDKSGASNAQPPAGTDKADAGVPGAVPHKRLLLPVVRGSWLPWRGRSSDAPSHQ